MKNTLFISIALLILAGCKKTSINEGIPSQHLFTSTKTVTLTVSSNAIVSKNSNGYWIVTGSSYMSPIIDSVVVTGSLYYDMYDGATFKYTQKDNTDLGLSTLDILPPNIVNPNISNVYFQPDTWTSTGSIEYFFNFQ